MKRRQLLRAIAFLPAVLLGTARETGAATRAAADASVAALRERWRDLLRPGFVAPSPGQRLEHSPKEWRDILEPGQFAVLREEGTERPYTSALNEEKRAGVYLCVGCELPLFTSEMKYDSGTGWPSFFTAIPGAFETKTDWKLLVPRTEYHCARCGGHHGHVFDDGPRPTGERWCNNGVALRFLPRDV
jgi:peptide-methionine (R)-S-oxide reductase